MLFRLFRPLVSMNFFNVESLETYIMNSSREDALDKLSKPEPKKRTEKAQLLFDESKKKEVAANDKGSLFDQPSSN